MFKKCLFICSSFTLRLLASLSCYYDVNPVVALSGPNCVVPFNDSLVSSPRSTHLGSGNMYLITSRESYSCDCDCSRKDFAIQTSDFFSCYNLIIK